MGESFIILISQILQGHEYKDTQTQEHTHTFIHSCTHAYTCTHIYIQIHTQTNSITRHIVFNLKKIGS